MRPILKKAVFELRYRPSLRFFDVLYSSASRLRDYSNWQTDRLSVTLMDITNRCGLVIGHTSLSYRQCSADRDLHTGRTRPILSDLLPALGISACTRVGLRRQFLTPVSMDFEDLVKVFRAKFLAASEPLESILPGTISDMMYAVDLKDGEDQYHVRSGPVVKSEISRYIKIEFTEEAEAAEALKNYPEVAALLDIDLYRSGEIQADDLSEWLASAEASLDALSTALLDHAFATRLEVEL